MCVVCVVCVCVCVCEWYVCGVCSYYACFHVVVVVMCMCVCGVCRCGVGMVQVWCGCKGVFLNSSATDVGRNGDNIDVAAT